MTNWQGLAEKQIKRYGTDTQIDQSIEEMAELTVALSHSRKGRADRQRILEEMVDVTIMLAQLKYIFDENEFDDMLQNRVAKIMTE
jgi:hypothetical protein